MTSGVKTYRFKLENQKVKAQLIKKRTFLITRLQELGVRVNKPQKMNIEHLELLVSSHRKTVEAREDYISKKQLEVAAENGLTKQDVIHRVDDLNWDTKNAIAVRKNRLNRKGKRKRRTALLQRINSLEQLGEIKKAHELEKELAEI